MLWQVSLLSTDWVQSLALGAKLLGFKPFTNSVTLTSLSLFPSQRKGDDSKSTCFTAFVVEKIKLVSLCEVPITGLWHMVNVK